MSFQNGKARDLMEFQQQQLEELRQSLQRSEVASQRLKRGKQRLQQSMEELTSRETYLTQKKERLLQELRKSSLSKDKNGAASSSDFSGISGVDPMEPRAGKFKTLGKSTSFYYYCLKILKANEKQILMKWIKLI